MWSPNLKTKTKKNLLKWFDSSFCRWHFLGIWYHFFIILCKKIKWRHCTGKLELELIGQVGNSIFLLNSLLSDSTILFSLHGKVLELPPSTTESMSAGSKRNPSLDKDTPISNGSSTSKIMYSRQGGKPNSCRRKARKELEGMRESARQMSGLVK